ncbi:MAG: hypothetical protein R6V67_04635 [Spirochaetia bacterium]
MKLSFKLRRTEEGLITLKLNFHFRAVFLLFFLIVALGAYTVGAFESLASSIFPSILLILFLLVFLYEESWYFALSEGRIIHAHGLLPFKRYYVFPLDSIKKIEISRFRKGSSHEGSPSGERRFFQRDFTRLTLVLNTGERHDIRLEDDKSRSELLRQGREIAQFLGLPLSTGEEAPGEEGTPGEEGAPGENSSG